MKAFVKSDPQNRRAIVSLHNLASNQERAIRQAFYYIGKDLVHDTKRAITEKNKRGRLYRLRRNGRIILHRASAPGQSPANFTGGLKSSIDFNVVGANRLQFGSRENFLNKGGGIVSLKTRSGVKYGRALELGNATNNLEPRPYLKPTIESNFRNIRAHFERQLEKSIRTGGRR
jgi:hypothetical protein